MPTPLTDPSTGKPYTLQKLQKLVQDGTIDPATAQRWAMGKSAKAKLLGGYPKGYGVTKQVPVTYNMFGTHQMGNQTFTRQSPALYYQGDELGGADGFPNTPQGIKDLQMRLIHAGLLNITKNPIFPGLWDSHSAKAFAELLKTSNQSAALWDDTLTSMTNAVDQNEALQKAASTRQRQPLVIRLTDPTDIASAAQAVGKSLHGTYLSPEELAKFTANYQKMEQDYQTKAYTATGYDPTTGQQDPAQIDPTTGEISQPAGAGGATLTAPPNLGSATEPGLLGEAIRKSNPRQFEANTFTDRLDEILQGLKGNPNATQVGPSA